jgi:hypothetical protein
VIEHSREIKIKANTVMDQSKAQEPNDSREAASSEIHKTEIISMNLPGDNARVFLKDKQIVSKHTKQLQECFHSIRMYEYFSGKYHWSSAVIDKIRWDVHGKTLWTRTDGKRQTIERVNFLIIVRFKARLL